MDILNAPLIDESSLAPHQRQNLPKESIISKCKHEFGVNTRDTEKNTTLYATSCRLFQLRPTETRWSDMGATNLSLIKNMHTGATCLALKSLSSNANNDVDALQSFRFSHLVSSKMRVQELSSTQLVWCVNSYTAKHVAAVEAKTFRARFSSAHEAAQFKREFNAAVLNRKSIHTVFTALRALSSTIRSCATSSHVEKRDAVEKTRDLIEDPTDPFTRIKLMPFDFRAEKSAVSMSSPIILHNDGRIRQDESNVLKSNSLNKNVFTKKKRQTYIGHYMGKYFPVIFLAFH